jgi:hypothetical protein
VQLGTHRKNPKRNEKFKTSIAHGSSEGTPMAQSPDLRFDKGRIRGLQPSTTVQFGTHRKNQKRMKNSKSP